MDGNPDFHKYKWLNLAKLAKAFARPSDEIVAVFYFTAYATWDPQKVMRHQNYVRALESKGVKPVLGEFKRKDRFCHHCKKEYASVEEKQTDVNIALRLFQTAIQNVYDTAVIISGDSDLIPAVEAVKSTFPDKTVGVVIPIGRRSESLKNAAHFHMKMKVRHLAASQFPDEVELDGKKILRPAKWR